MHPVQSPGVQKPCAPWLAKAHWISALGGGFAVLFYLAYFANWAFVFLAPVPLALLVESPRQRLVFLVVTIAGFLAILSVYFFFAVVSFAGLILVSLYHGVVIALSVVTTNWWRKRFSAPLAVLFPILWTGGEYWRMSGEMGMPLGLLAPPLHPQLWAIQIADLGGIYPLSFAVAIVGGIVAEMILALPDLQAGKKIFFRNIQRGFLATLSCWIFIGAYGAFRLDQARLTMDVGPTLAVIQPDAPSRPGTLHGFDPDLLLEELLAFSDEASDSDPPPNLLVWPEAPSGMPALNREWLSCTPNPANIDSEAIPVSVPGLREQSRSRMFESRIADWVKSQKIPILLGVESWHPPERGLGWVRRNAAIEFTPEFDAFRNRQFKIHLFPIGEYIPWEGTFLHDLLKSLVLWESGLSERLWSVRGVERKRFQLRGNPASTARSIHYVVSVCNEIMYPEDSGIFLSDTNRGKPIDLIVNISNNGSFLRNKALLLHSFLLPFRAVEARVGIARSSNTGISGFVKPTGEIYGEVTNTKGQRWTGLGAPELDLIEEVVRIRSKAGDQLGKHPKLLQSVQKNIEKIKRMRAVAGVRGVSVQPVWVDQRRTLYSQTGDVFGLCMLGAVLIGVGGIAVGRLTPTATNRQK